MNAIKSLIRVIFLGITLFTISSFSTPHLSIKGDWVSNADPKNGIYITDTKWMEVYDHSIAYKGGYQLDNKPCDAAYAKKHANKKMNFIKIEDGRCFELVEITAKKLAIRYTGSGNLNTFHKAN